MHPIRSDKSLHQNTTINCLMAQMIYGLILTEVYISPIPTIKDPGGTIMSMPQDCQAVYYLSPDRKTLIKSN